MKEKEEDEENKCKICDGGGGQPPVLYQDYNPVEYIEIYFI